MDAIKIEVVYEVNDGEEMGLYAEGHHEPAAFVAAVAEWRKGDGQWLDEGYIPEVPLDEVRHETWRNEDGGEGYVFRPSVPGETGAYPVTCFAFEGGTLAAAPAPAARTARSAPSVLGEGTRDALADVERALTLAMSSAYLEGRLDEEHATDREEWTPETEASRVAVHDALEAALRRAAPGAGDAGLAPWYEADGSTLMLPAEEVERRRKLAAKVIAAARRVRDGSGWQAELGAVAHVEHLGWLNDALRALDAAAPPSSPPADSGEKIREALRGCLAYLWPAPDEGHTGFVDRLGMEFYRETGVWPHFKSAPMEMHTSDAEEARKKWTAWLEAKRDAAAAAAARALSPSTSTDAGADEKGGAPR